MEKVYIEYDMNKEMKANMGTYFEIGDYKVSFGKDRRYYILAKDGSDLSKKKIRVIINSRFGKKNSMIIAGVLGAIVGLGVTIMF